MSTFDKHTTKINHIAYNIKPYTTENVKDNSVLVIVDVQNCFMIGGSFLGHMNNQTYTDDDINNFYDAIKQIEEIVTLIDKNKYIGNRGLMYLSSL